MVFRCACLKTMISTLGVLDRCMPGKDFTEYDRDYKLRTDAVWEKYQLKDWFRMTTRVTILRWRFSTLTSISSNINSPSLKTFTCKPLNLGDTKKINSWIGRASHQLDAQTPSKQDWVPSKKLKIPSTASTQCPITISCAPCDSKNGSNAIWYTAVNEPDNSIVTPKPAWPTWKTKIITLASGSTMRQDMPAQITFWPF